MMWIRSSPRFSLSAKTIKISFFLFCWRYFVVFFPCRCYAVPINFCLYFIFSHSWCPPLYADFSASFTNMLYYLHIMCLSKLIVIVLPQLYKKKLFCSYIILSCCSCIYAGFSVLFSYATLSVYFFQCTLSRPSYCTPSVQYYTLFFLMYSVTPIVLQPVNTGICVYFFSSPPAVVRGG